MGVRIRLVTNNTTDKPGAIAEKLRQAGFAVQPEEVTTCTSAAIGKLRAMGVSRVLVVGSQQLKELFAEAGLQAVGAVNAEAVVVGLDEELTYRSLQEACEALVNHSAALIGLHHNRLYRNAAGRIAPSVGAIVEALAYASQIKPIVIGKPSEDFFRQALGDIGLDACDVLMVSDDPISDLAGAKRMGMPAAFVLTGKYRDESALASIEACDRPDAVVSTISDLLATAFFERA